ncbi:MAG: LytTR family transcriptional regulator DNA-binding domain-containing protein [Robiginitomaculum sp.]|nr:LytTR family transcriptional regulator DNA-binding domain-containing protein [Robiginitomaculum sp.]
MKSIVKNMAPMLTVCTIAGVILTVLAPYGTSVFSPFPRFVYWVGLCLAGGFGASAANVIAYVFKREFGPWQMALVQSVTSTLAVSTIILIMALIAYGMPSAKNFFITMFYVWVIAAVISSIGALLSRQKNDKPAPERAVLYERLPPHLRSADIYALAAEDHYVRVITARGGELVLMRLSDAVKETAPIKGLSPHRSWWVAEAGVDKVNKSEIILRSGQTVPISRTGMKLVRAAGWK